MGKAATATSNATSTRFPRGSLDRRDDDGVDVEQGWQEGENDDEAVRERRRESEI